MTVNPFKIRRTKVVAQRRGKSARQMAKDVTAALVAKTAEPGLRRYNLSLPPLSLNNVYQNRADGGRRVGPKYKEWLVRAGWEIRAQRPTPVASPFVCQIEIGAKASRADLDNLAKPLIDLMVEMGCVADDRNLVELTMRRTDGEGVTITVWTQGWSAPEQLRRYSPSELRDLHGLPTPSTLLPAVEPPSICAETPEILGTPV